MRNGFGVPDGPASTPPACLIDINEKYYNRWSYPERLQSQDLKLTRMKTPGQIRKTN